MDSNLIISDEYIEEVGKACAKRGNVLDEILYSFILILKEIRQEAIIEGETAQALGEFIDCISRLRNQLQDISDNVNEACKYFVIDVNDADSFLF